MPSIIRRPVGPQRTLFVVHFLDDPSNILARKRSPSEAMTDELRQARSASTSSKAPAVSSEHAVDQRSKRRCRAPCAQGK